MTHSCEKHSHADAVGPIPTVDTLIEQCRAKGLRRTFLLKKVLALLLEHERPLNVQEILKAPEIGGNCDVATCYRLLGRLEERGIIRQIGSHERAAHFILNIPGRHREYLICTECGKVDIVNLPCPVHEMEQSVRKQTGYSNIYHELQFFGRCPAC